MQKKSILYFCFLTLLTNFCEAQSPILDSTVTIHVGQLAQINIINNALSIPSGSAGPAQTYDYLLLPSFNSNYEILGIDNLTSPFGSAYPTANATVSWSSFGSPYYHFQLSNNAYTYLGGGGSFGDYSYIDAYDQLRFPFTYNDTYTDSFLAISNTGGYRAGMATVTGDGYGTLLVPNQIFTDVLRVKRESAYYDTISGNPRYTEETYYEYYKQGIPHYILLHGFYTITSGTSNPVSGSQLFFNSAAIVTGLEAPQHDNSNYFITHNGSEWMLHAKEELNTHMHIYNLQGQLVAQSNLMLSKEGNGKVIAHDQLANGFYIIQFINLEGKMVNLKWNKVD